MRALSYFHFKPYFWRNKKVTLSSGIVVDAEEN